MKKISDPTNKSWTDALNESKCMHPSHNPPGNIVLEPGLYEHECPACGRKSYVNVPITTYL